MKKLILLILLLFPLCTIAKEKVTFSKCVDGDTFKVIKDKEEITIRLLAVDTPESVSTKKEVEPYGKESSEFTCNLVKNAKVIELEYDDNSDKLDKYNRTLAWVFIDDVLLQDKLITNGYAKVAYLYGDYKYTTLLQEHEKVAQNNKLNIWSDSSNTTIVESVIDDEPLSTKEKLYIVFSVLVFILYPYIKKELKKISKKSKIKHV